MPIINNPHSSVASEANPTVPSELRRYLDQAGRVVIWPAKRAIRMQIYAYLAAFFQPERIYSEKEVNQLLARYL
ncbi:MAG TPA: DUF2087 domain-containing protein, partial [Ktedonobacteraceae bacterium]|nr:DUF2087 domain-containing protein [Ktedonobacteraceae bacterium]